MANRRGDIDWTKPLMDRLEALWNEMPQISTSEIGRRMGIRKDAIVNKAHRMKLPARPSPISHRDPNSERSRIRRPIPRVTGSTLPPLASLSEPLAVETASGFSFSRRTVFGDD
jgi:GcrA cell cycle regulator